MNSLHHFLECNQLKTLVFTQTVFFLFQGRKLIGICYHVIRCKQKRALQTYNANIIEWLWVKTWPRKIWMAASVFEEFPKLCSAANSYPLLNFHWTGERCFCVVRIVGQRKILSPHEESRKELHNRPLHKRPHS